MVVIGTKLDRVKGDTTARQVTEAEATEFSAAHGAPYFETSAKDGLNVISVFDTIGYHCLATKLSTMVSEASHTAASPAAANGPIVTGHDRPAQAAENICCIIQ